MLLWLRVALTNWLMNVTLACKSGSSQAEGCGFKFQLAALWFSNVRYEMTMELTRALR